MENFHFWCGRPGGRCRSPHICFGLFWQSHPLLLALENEISKIILYFLANLWPWLSVTHSADIPADGEKQICHMSHDKWQVTCDSWHDICGTPNIPHKHPWVILVSKIYDLLSTWSLKAEIHGQLINISWSADFYIPSIIFLYSMSS